MSDHIIVIGAGIAGLTAARLLSQHGRVTILEANSRIGGRTQSSLETGFRGVIEHGAEFIHGNAEHTIALLKEAGIAYQQSKGKMYRSENGRLVTEREAVEDWDELMQRMEQVQDETTLHDFLQVNFPAERHTALRAQAERYAEGFDLADVKTVTVRSLYEEWSNESWESYHIPTGYQSLVEYLSAACHKNGCGIITGATVNKIEWSANKATLHCSNGQTFNAAKVLITVPVSILQQETIRFSPAIPNYIQASQNIGWGMVIRVLLEFDETFWPADMGFAFSNETFPTWWTQLPDKRPLLTGWLGGKNAKVMKDATDDEMLNTALNSIANILNKPIAELKQKLIASKVFNWQCTEWVRGGYSFSIAGSDAAKQLLNTPVDDTLYFAGEALYTGPHPGTVEAAIISAKQAAGDIIGALV